MSNKQNTVVIEHKIIIEHQHRLCFSSCIPLVHLLIMIAGNFS